MMTKQYRVTVPIAGFVVLLVEAEIVYVSQQRIEVEEA